jgi:hypothetical protein
MAKQTVTKSKTEPQAETQTGQEGHGRINKSEAVRRALADGVVQPIEGVAYIKSHFGIEIGPQHFSAVKSNTMKRLGTSTVNTRFQPKSAKTAARTTTVNGESDLIESLETLKPLVAQFGVEKVRRLVDLLG